VRREGIWADLARVEYGLLGCGWGVGAEVGVWPPLKEESRVAIRVEGVAQKLEEVGASERG